MTTRARPPPPKAAPERTGEPGEQRRLDLVEAAYAVVAEKGLEGLRTRDVAARAGVNVSTLHYYFDTKEALLVALVDHVRDKFSGPRPTRRSAGGSALRAHFEGAWRTFQATPHLSTVLQELVLRSRRDAATRAAFRSLHNDWNGIVEELLRAAVTAGELRADLDPRAGARAVTSFIMGAMVQLDVNSKAFDFGAVARQLEAWVLAPPADEAKAPQRLAGGPSVPSSRREREPALLTSTSRRSKEFGRPRLNRLPRPTLGLPNVTGRAAESRPRAAKRDWLRCRGLPQGYKT